MEFNKHDYIMIISPLQSRRKQINTTHQRDLRVCLTMTNYKLKTSNFFSQLALGTPLFHHKRKHSNLALSSLLSFDIQKTNLFTLSSLQFFFNLFILFYMAIYSQIRIATSCQQGQHGWSSCLCGQHGDGDYGRWLAWKTGARRAAEVCLLAVYMGNEHG